MKLSQKIKLNADVGIATAIELPASDYLPEVMAPPPEMKAYIIFAFEQNGSFTTTGVWPTLEDCKQHLAANGYLTADAIDANYSKYGNNIISIPYQDLISGPGYQKGQKVWVSFENKTRIAEIVSAITPYQFEVKYENGENGYVVPGVLRPYLEDTQRVQAVLDLTQIRRAWEAYKKFFKEEPINQEESRPFDFVGFMEFLASDHLEKYYKEDES